MSMCVSMKTVVNPRTHQHEVVAISGLVYTKVDADVDTVPTASTCAVSHS